MVLRPPGGRGTGDRQSQPGVGREDNGEASGPLKVALELGTENRMSRSEPGREGAGEGGVGNRTWARALRAAGGLLGGLGEASWGPQRCEPVALLRGSWKTRSGEGGRSGGHSRAPPGARSSQWGTDVQPDSESPAGAEAGKRPDRL